MKCGFRVRRVCDTYFLDGSTISDIYNNNDDVMVMFVLYQHVYFRLFVYILISASPPECHSGYSRCIKIYRRNRHEY